MKLHPYLLTLICFLPMSLFASNALTIGDPAPGITVTTHSGETVDLSEAYAKGPVLVYFYPKADTPGCTAQACNIRDNFADLREEGISVFGVSTDSVESQNKFQQKYELPFTLVADTDKALGKAFGVGSYAGMAYKRQSFLVVDGKVAWRDLKASPSTQSSDILKALADSASEE